MSGWLVPVATIAFLSVVSGICGEPVALWLSSVMLAFCLGVFWGAGENKRKEPRS